MLVKIDHSYLKELESMSISQDKRYVDFSDCDLRGFRVRKNYGGTISFLVGWKIREKREEVVIGKYPLMTVSNARICATGMLAEKLKNRRVSAWDDESLSQDDTIINSFMPNKTEAKTSMQEGLDTNHTHKSTPPKKGRFSSMAKASSLASPVEESAKSEEDKIMNMISAVNKATIMLVHIGTKTDEEFRTNTFNVILNDCGEASVLKAANDYLKTYNRATEGLMDFEKASCIKDANLMLRRWVK